MKKPQKPPELSPLLHRTLEQRGGEFLASLFTMETTPGSGRYMPWDQFRWRKPPAGITRHEWWLAAKFSRHGMQRTLPLSDTNSHNFTYALPDDVLRGIESVDKHASGQIEVPEPVTHDAPTRARYVVNSLIEEAITSSQLEGASTTYGVAKNMLRSGRKPRTRDERMILNNYEAMRQVGDLRHERLTPELICNIHKTVTEGTLDDPDLAGRIQLPSDNRVVVEDYAGNILHTPPPAEQLPERLEKLCDFANGISDTAYVPPVVRAIVVHFTLAYDHPFVDGNGRTARALFYWSMLAQDYWLTEFLSISRLIKEAPAKYARSFIYCEQDENDLTYFLIHQLEVIQRSILDLQSYLKRKVAETRELQRSLAEITHRFNHRQIAILEHAAKNPSAQYTVSSHSISHRIVPQTARKDLQDLEKQGLLFKVPAGRGFAWLPTEDIPSRLASETH